MYMYMYMYNVVIQVSNNMRHVHVLENEEFSAHPSEGT
jgi:hypothetical protein